MYEYFCVAILIQIAAGKKSGSFTPPRTFIYLSPLLPVSKTHKKVNHHRFPSGSFRVCTDPDVETRVTASWILHSLCTRVYPRSVRYRVFVAATPPRKCQRREKCHPTQLRMRTRPPGETSECRWGDVGGCNNALPLPGEDPCPCPPPTRVSQDPRQGPVLLCSSFPARQGDSPTSRRTPAYRLRCLPQQQQQQPGVLDRDDAALRADSGTHQRSSVCRRRGQLLSSPAHKPLGTRLGRQEFRASIWGPPLQSDALPRTAIFICHRSHSTWITLRRLVRAVLKHRRRSSG